MNFDNSLVVVLGVGAEARQVLAITQSMAERPAHMLFVQAFNHTPRWAEDNGYVQKLRWTEMKYTHCLREDVRLEVCATFDDVVSIITAHEEKRHIDAVYTVRGILGDQEHDWRVELGKLLMAVQRGKSFGTLRPLGMTRMLQCIDPTAFVDPTAWLAPNVVVHPRAYIGLSAEVHGLSIISTHAVVEHDSVVGPGAFIGPNATLCGDVVVGVDAIVGAGAVLTPGAHVPDKGFVKAGERYSKAKS